MVVLETRLFQSGRRRFSKSAHEVGLAWILYSNFAKFSSVISFDYVDWVV
jgi:hypothetical protein